MPNKLPPILDKNLRVVFIGTEPGPDSVEHYYSNPDNSFYSDLEETGWTSKKLRPEQDSFLLSEGIGLDDIYDDKESLKIRLEEYKPRTICFNSKEALRRFSSMEIESPWIGKNASKYVGFSWKPIVWALIDSSPRAEKKRHIRQKYLKELLIYAAPKKKPIRYKKIYIKLAFEIISKSGSIKEFANQIQVDLEKIIKWRGNYPEFNTAIERAESISLIDKCFSTEFPKNWQLNIQGLTSGTIQNRNRKSKIESGFPRFLISYHLFELFGKEDGINRCKKIVDWFRSKPILEIHTRNDLFFGFGFLMPEQASWRKYRPRVFKILPKLDNSNPDYLFYKDLKRAIANYPSPTEEWRTKLKENLIKIFKSFHDKSLILAAEEEQKIWKKIFGQEIPVSSDSKRKFSLYTKKALKFLIESLAHSKLCLKDGRSSEKKKMPLNYSIAARYLKELAVLFDIQLPKNLRKLH